MNRTCLHAFCVALTADARARRTIQDPRSGGRRHPSQSPSYASTAARWRLGADGKSAAKPRRPLEPQSHINCYARLYMKHTKHYWHFVKIEMLQILEVFKKSKSIATSARGSFRARAFFNESNRSNSEKWRVHQKPSKIMVFGSLS